MDSTPWFSPPTHTVIEDTVSCYLNIAALAGSMEMALGLLTALFFFEAFFFFFSGTVCIFTGTDQPLAFEVALKSTVNLSSVLPSVVLNS